MILDLIYEYGGEVTFDDLSLISEKNSLKQQVDYLKEDLFQANFDRGQLIDIGWYPSLNAKGEFQIRLVKDFNWDDPLFFGKAKNVVELKDVLAVALLELNK